MGEFIQERRADRELCHSDSCLFPAAVGGSVVRDSAHHMASFFCTNFMGSVQKIHFIHGNIQHCDVLLYSALRFHLTCLHFIAAQP